MARRAAVPDTMWPMSPSRNEHRLELSVAIAAYMITGMSLRLMDWVKSAIASGIRLSSSAFR
jgi:hypothetical protein